MPEFELKLQVPADRAGAVEAAVRRGKVRETHLRARYFDTPDEALARAALVLRLRQEGDAWVQAAKGPGSSAFERLEHEVVVDAGAADQPPRPELHRDTPVGKALRKALAHADGGLRCVYETDVSRLARSVDAAGAVVEIAFDRGRLVAGDAERPVLEIEFELKQGSPAAAAELAQRWCEKHGLWLDPLSKSQAARRLARGEEPPPATQAAPVRAGATPKALAAAILDAALAQVLGNARELAVGGGGDAHVHQLRVGLRRLRVALRERDALGDTQTLDAGVEEALGNLFSVLGTHRDRSTLLPALQEELSAAGSPAPRWTPALPDVGAAVRAPAVQSALLQLVAHVQDLRVAAGQERGGLKAARQAVDARLDKLHRRVLRGGRHFEALAQEERHALRKRLKRLRYLAELAAPLYDAAGVDDYVRALKALQDALGRYQDAVAGAALFRGHAAQQPAAWFAVGWLACREEVLAVECGEACRKAARRARPFWG